MERAAQRKRPPTCSDATPICLVYSFFLSVCPTVFACFLSLYLPTMIACSFLPICSFSSVCPSVFSYFLSFRHCVFDNGLFVCTYTLFSFCPSICAVYIRSCYFYIYDHSLFVSTSLFFSFGLSFCVCLCLSVYNIYVACSYLFVYLSISLPLQSIHYPLL